MKSLMKVIDWKQKSDFANAAKSRDLESARSALASAADVRPIGARTKFFASNRAFGFALDFNRQLRSTLTMAISDLS